MIIFSKIKFISKHINKIQTAFDSSSKLLALTPLVSMTALSIISWGFECFGYYLIIKSFYSDINIFGRFLVTAFLQLLALYQCYPVDWELQKVH